VLADGPTAARARPPGQPEEAGLSESTLVVFTSDNGGLSTSEGHPTSNLPLRGGKGWLYEGGIREPWIVRWPGVTAPGTTCDAPITSQDLLPTVLEAVGAAPPDDREIDGVSFVPCLRGAKELERGGPLVWHYPHYGNQGGFPGAALLRGDWKLLERHEDGRVHLYDLASDPGERRDLAGERPELVRELRAELHAWYEAMDARFLRPVLDEDSPFHGLEPWRPGREEE
jgi:arylsulfatase A-like enzyme